MIGLAEIAEIAATIIATSISTALATAFMQYYRQKWNERKNMYRGFLKEVRQNIKFADHNLEKLDKEERVELLPFRDDFWNMSLSGYLLELDSFLQKLLYETYMKQYVVGEKLMMLRREAQKMSVTGKQSWERPMSKKATQEIRDLKAKLEKAEVRLKTKVGSFRYFGA